MKSVSIPGGKFKVTLFKLMKIFTCQQNSYNALRQVLPGIPSAWPQPQLYRHRRVYDRQQSGVLIPTSTQLEASVAIAGR